MRTYQTDRSYLWPQTLLMPVRPPKVVYLDLNHWITLAQVSSGSRDKTKDREILDFCLTSMDNGSAVFPISMSIYTEILKTKNPSIRRKLRKIIERLGQYFVITNRVVVATHEIEALLDNRIGSNPVPINTMPYLDWGVYRAFGMDGNIKVKSRDGKDTTSAFRQSFTNGPTEFDRIERQAHLELNRQMIEGPLPEEEPELRRQDYNPEAILEQYVLEAKSEEELARALDENPRWRRGRLSDIVSFREVRFHIHPNLQRGLDERSVTSLRRWFASDEDMRNGFNSMPSFDVSVTLKTFIHRNGRHRWSNNDVHDIHALAIALPYCDIVVTDRAMASLAIQAKLAERLNTVVLSKLSDLPKWI